MAGDLDGDGLGDLVVGLSNTWTYIYRQRPDGTFDEFPLDGVSPLAVIDVDGDGTDELVVNSADAQLRVFVLGVGSDSLPALSPPSVLPADVPVSDDPVLIARWSRAEDLVAMGLSEFAVERFQSLAALAAGTAIEGRALYRAGQILEDHGSVEQAGQLYRRAAEFVEVAAAAWEGALRAHLANHHFEQALQAARTRLGLPDPPPGLAARAHQLEQRLTMKPLVLDFTQPLDPRLRVGNPLDVRRDIRAGGLRLGGGHERPLLELELERTGGPVSISIELTLDRMDWASAVEADLLGPGTSEHFRFRWAYAGGSGVYRDAGGGPVVQLSRFRTPGPAQTPTPAHVGTGAAR